MLDCFIDAPVTMTYQLLWRRGGSDTVVTEFSQSYVRGSDDNIPQNSSFTETGTAIDYQPGDQLVLNFIAGSDSPVGAYDPNGDGPGPGGSGRFPNITLPQ